MTGALDDLVLTIDNFNATFEGTYVCRTENIAGRDADVVTLVTGKVYVVNTAITCHFVEYAKPTSNYFGSSHY